MTDVTKNIFGQDSNGHLKIHPRLRRSHHFSVDNPPVARLIVGMAKNLKSLVGKSGYFESSWGEVCMCKVVDADNERGPFGASPQLRIDYVTTKDGYPRTVERAFLPPNEFRLGTPPKPGYTISDVQVQEWAERYQVQGSIQELRCAFEDARTMQPDDSQ